MAFEELEAIVPPNIEIMFLKFKYSDPDILRKAIILTKSAPGADCVEWWELYLNGYNPIDLRFFRPLRGEKFIDLIRANIGHGIHGIILIIAPVF